ncbi:hypothetical protein ACSIGC_14220 [Tenacibaculum sp. ZS6-P6]|uniref:hypothetical protein n=1 Tax=Tenacibaculum sp. ZS6-P6 TaxID=3447503 RepID=UPI003F94CB7E
MKKVLILLFLTTTAVFAQKDVNNYKYILVPKQFDGFKKADQYQTSSLIKFLLEKSNFTVFLEDESLPTDLATDRCKALTANLLNDSGIFSTKVQIEFKDCFNKTIYTSVLGKNKLKDYKRAYHKAIRDAFKSIQQLNYKYIPEANEKPIAVNNSVSSTKVAVNKVENTVKQADVNVEEKVNEAVSGILYAQPKDYGFQLINDIPEVVFKLLKTKNPNTFIIKDKNGTFTKKQGNIWSAEFYENDKLVTKLYSVKF